ncbi:hypothetical protein LCGC14_1915700 [marine sediment metagenome]|uniref:Uncharacterized protein n=1 Tax=marine sediment metagenome TaxID=412755 RepID=A0A0F9FT17_9ZZZZ
MDLYTSLVRLKQEMTNGTLPAMMPVPEKIQGVIDPAFTIGLGALFEDPDKGLRCPVRDCGVYRHTLTRHLNTRHSALGGASGIKKLMSIPLTARLTSRSAHEKYSLVSTGRPFVGVMSKKLFSRAAKKRKSRSTISAKATVGAKNLRDVCEAQLAHKLIDLEHELGRSPSMADARLKFGPGFASAVERTYGSWNSAKGQIGLKVYPHNRKYGEVAVIDALRAYYDEHGCLPMSRVAHLRFCKPLIPSHKTILLTLNMTSWSMAMRYVASVLNIPERKVKCPKPMILWSPRGRAIGTTRTPLGTS